MFSKVKSIGILGIDGYLVEVEADVSNGLPGFSMVGFLSSEVREAEERVRTALKNCGFHVPSKKITVNLSPADIRKEGTGFDLPIAAAILAANGMISSTVLEDSVLIGELGLNGEIKGIHGVLSRVIAAKDLGISQCFLPLENLNEGRLIAGVDVVGIETIQQFVEYLQNPESLKEQEEPVYREVNIKQKDIYTEKEMNYSEINGQFLLRRATEVAVAGRHNILMIGQAGTGKTMIAQRIPTIMPSISEEENLEISKIYSICGMLPKSALLSKRPFRSPHHTISATALTGGGRRPRPGEISLASGGVLFLDELTEFKRSTLEVLRQPLEEHRITIDRLYGSCIFPADIMLVAAANPCPCGFYPNREKCHCTEQQVHNYLGKISKPLLDRIDICVESAPVTYDELTENTKGESSELIRKRIQKAGQIQSRRFAGTGKKYNSEMNGIDIKQYCQLKNEDQDFVKEAFFRFDFSPRSYHKIMKVARTIADLENSKDILHEHLCEAISYRTLTRQYLE